MRITCPTCDTSYTIADDKIGAKGRSVRCASCGTKWAISLADAEQDAPAAAPERTPPAPSPADEFADTDSFDPPPAPAASRTFDPGPPDPVAARPVEPPQEEIAPKRPVDIETLAQKPKIKATKKKPVKASKPFKFDMDRFLVRARPIFGALILLLSLSTLGAAVVFRTYVVSAFPSLAMLYEKAGLPVNLRGLVFQKVEMLREVDNSQPVLVVEGELENPTSSEREVPAIRFALRGDDHQEIYAWSIEPKTVTLTPGANMRFRTRLASPPEQASDIQVRMIDRRNRQASTQ